MITKENERAEWLDNLKIGDEVAIDVGAYGNRNYEIRKITRITPTRRFSLEGKGAEFDSSGRERGKRDSWRGSDMIIPVTQEIKDHIRKKYIVSRMGAANWKHLDLDKLEKLLSVLDE